MIPTYEFRQCLQCSFIEDCPHPTVNEAGHPIPPTCCVKAEKIKLIRRVDELIPPDGE